MFSQCMLLLAVLISYNLIFVATLFEGCDSNVNLTPLKTEKFESPKYSCYDVRRRYTSGTSCRMHYIAPHGYIIRVKGIVSLDVNYHAPNCQAQGQRFIVSRNGNRNFSDADSVCASNAVNFDSIGNEMTIGYISETDGQGRFQVFVDAIKISTENCNCGWGLYYNYVKPKNLRVFQGFTSIVGVIHVEKDEIVCTGVIITFNYVLSSASCYFQSTENIASNLQLITGYKSYPSNDDPFYTTSYSIDSIKVHESYSGETVSQINDIAVIKVKNPIRFTRGVSPICLPSAKSFLDEEFYIKRAFAIAGWSKYNNDGQQQFLHDSSATYLPVTNCSTLFKTFTVSNPHLCLSRYNTTAIYPEYPGAGLFYASGERKFLVGLYNMKIKAASSQPMVFTRIATYISWIQRNIENQSICNRFY